MPVARIGESVSYSDKLRAQADLINKRRQQNLDVEIAQEEKNREFTNQQLQAFYDFDVSGMSPEHIKAIGKLQASMANSLDPNSEDHYQNSEQLIADIAFLNNTYNVASRYRDQRQTGTQQMLALMTGEVDAGPGQEFVNEGMDGLKNANAVWDQGGFSSEINVGGTAGNRSISGVPLVPNPEGGWMEGEGEVNFFESPLTNDPTSIYRPTIIAAAPILSKMAEAAMSDEALNGTNIEEVASLRWDTMSESKKEQIAREEYERLATDGTAAFEELTEKQKKALGIDDESLKNTYRDRLQEGVGARPRAVESDVFDFNRTVARMPKLSEAIKLRSQNEEFAGTIEGAQLQKDLDLDTLQTAPNGAPLIPVEVAYVNSSGNTLVKILDPVKNPDDYDAFMEAIGRRGKEQLLEYSGYYVTPEGPQVDVGEDPQALNPAVDQSIREDLGISEADSSPGAKLESDRQLLLLDIEDAEADLRFQQGISGNFKGQLDALERLVELQEQLGPLNDNLEALGIDRIESDGVDVSAADASARAEAGSEAGSVAAAALAAAAQADPATTETGDAESRPPQTESTEAQAPQNTEQPSTGRDLSGLPTISPIARSASDSIAMSEGYSPDLQINVPDTTNSGVTIAGLDIGGLNPGGDSVKMDILRIYLSPEDFSALEQLVGLRGSEARQKLEEFQKQGLLKQDGLGLTEQDIIDIPALYVSSVELPKIYKVIPEEEFVSLPSDVRNVVLDVEFNVHGPNTLKKIREAIRSGDKASWMEIANTYYNPETGATYFGSKEQTQQKIDSGNIGRGNVKRVKAARKNLLAWIEKTYG